MSMFEYFLRRAAFLLFFLFSQMLQLPVLAQAQVKQPTLSNKVERVAYVDHSSLRRQYGALQAAHSKAREKWQTNQQRFNREQEEFERTLQTQLRQDSLSGGSRRTVLRQQAQAKQESFKRSYEERQRQLHHNRIDALRSLEAKINEAIQEVVSEGGFTDVRPLEKKASSAKGEDITGKVLRKLN